MSNGQVLWWWCGWMNEWIDMMKWHGWPTKGVKLIVSRNSCQRLSPSWIHDPPRAGFEPAYNQTLSFVEWSVLWNNHSFNYVVWVGSFNIRNLGLKLRLSFFPFFITVIFKIIILSMRHDENGNPICHNWCNLTWCSLTWCNSTWCSSIENGFFWQFWMSWILLQIHLIWNLCMHPKFIRLKTT